jgi:hypothetical protein
MAIVIAGLACTCLADPLLMTGLTFTGRGVQVFTNGIQDRVAVTGDAWAEGYPPECDPSCFTRGTAEVTITYNDGQPFDLIGAVVQGFPVSYQTFTDLHSGKSVSGYFGDGFVDLLFLDTTKVDWTLDYTADFYPNMVEFEGVLNEYQFLPYHPQVAVPEPPTLWLWTSAALLGLGFLLPGWRRRYGPFRKRAAELA